MLNHGPMSLEQLDEIRGRVDLMKGNPPVDIWSELVGERKAPAYHAAPKDLMNLVHEVERLRRFESIVAWWDGDAGDGKMQVAMTHRAARALAERFMEYPHLQVGALGHNFYPDARAALGAALDNREEA